MFFSKSFIIATALAAQALGHAVVQPVMGVNGQAARSDTQRPTNARPCGRTALSEMDSSESITMTGTTFTPEAINFNARRDGSLQFTASVDPTGSGNSFQPATITNNGPAAPPRSGTTAQLSVELPEGTVCSGGASGDMCLVSFRSASGFGNCVVVKQAGAGAANRAATPKTGAKAARAHPRDFALPLSPKPLTRDLPRSINDGKSPV